VRACMRACEHAFVSVCACRAMLTKSSAGTGCLCGSVWVGGCMHVCVRACVRLFACVRACMRACEHAFVSVCACRAMLTKSSAGTGCLCGSVWVGGCMRECVRACVRLFACVRACVRASMHLSLCVHACVRVCVWMYVVSLFLSVLQVVCC